MASQDPELNEQAFNDKKARTYLRDAQFLLQNSHLAHDDHRNHAIVLVEHTIATVTELVERNHCPCKSHKPSPSR